MGPRVCLWLTAFAVACSDPSRNAVFTPADASSDGTAATDAALVDRAVGADVMRCARSADCDDGLACTDDDCVIGGVCEHTAVSSRCPTGQRCLAGVGCASATACTTSAQCDDNVACTRDLCAAGGRCQNLNDDAQCPSGQVCTSAGCAAPGSCRTDADCDDRMFCNGTERCVSGRCSAGTAVDCRDTDPCTGDVCNDAMARCEHPMATMCGGVVAPGTYDLTPAIAYSCGAGTVGPIAQITLAVSASGVTVTGLPATLTGPAPTDGMFTATGSESRGGCTWRYTLNGSFTAANRFAGSWNLTFDNCSAALSCFSRSGLVDGARR